MRLTTLRLFASNRPSSPSLAYGTAVFDDALGVSFAVLRNPKGDVFVSWPSVCTGTDQSTGKKKYVDQVIWEDKTRRTEVEKQIFDEYNRKIGINNSVEPPPRSQAIPEAPAPEPEVPFETPRRKSPVQWAVPPKAN